MESDDCLIHEAMIPQSLRSEKPMRSCCNLVWSIYRRSLFIFFLTSAYPVLVSSTFVEFPSSFITTYVRVLVELPKIKWNLLESFWVFVFEILRYFVCIVIVQLRNSGT